MNNYNINLAKAANLTAILMKLAGAYERIAKSGYSDAFVLFPFLFLRRVDCILSDKVKAMADYYQANKDVLSKEELVVGLKQISGSEFYNVSGLSLSSLVENSKEIAINMHYYVEGFDDSIKNILFAFNFKHSIEALNSKHILSNIIDDFIAMNFGEGAFPSKNIWKDFNRISYFISGLNFSFNPYSTPESVSKLMCAMLFGDYEHNLRVDQKLSSIYDTTCGIGGSLYTTKNYFDNVVCKNNTCHSYLSLYGQEINSKSCAVAKSVALLSGMDESNFKIGDSLLDDKFKDEKFDYVISNFPLGTNWSYSKKEILADSKFKIGIPSQSDATMLFIQDIISKMNNNGRACFITSYSALTSGDFASGENSVRKYLVDNDMIECIVSLQLLFSPVSKVTPYLWILSKSKEERRRGKVQLIDASKVFNDSRLEKNPLSDEEIESIRKTYIDFKDTSFSKVVEGKEFGSLRLTIEQPKRIEDEYEKDFGKVVFDQDGNLVPDISKEFYEIVPLKEDVNEYFKKKILPNIDEDSWINYAQTRIGYKFNFNRFFFKGRKYSFSDSQSALETCQMETSYCSEELANDDLYEAIDIKVKWLDTKLKFTCKIQQGNYVSSNFSNDFGYAYVLQSKDIDNGEINFDTCNQIPANEFIEKKFVVLEEGDLVLSISGTIGAPFIFKRSTKPVVLDSSLVRITEGGSKHCSILYIKQVLSSPLFQEYYERISSCFGTPRMSVTDLGNFSFKMPAEDFQDTIAEILDHQEELVNKYKASLEAEQKALADYRDALFMDVLNNGKD